MASLVKIVAILGCVLVIGVLPKAVLQDQSSAAIPHAALAEQQQPEIEVSDVSLVSDWRQVEQGSLVYKSENMLGYALSPAVDSLVNIDVSGMIARVSVQQTFVNPSDDWIHARYVFPLPEDAAVDHLTMRVGDRVIEGQIKAKQEAKKIFDKAKSEGKKASLVAQNRPNIFTNQIANIAPGEKVVVSIEYQQTARFDNNQFSLRFPMTVAPRYIPGEPLVNQTNEHGWAYDTDQVSDASDITPPVKRPDSRPNNIRLSVALNPGFPVVNVDSPYHNIAVNEDSKKGVVISLTGETIANRDFELVWQAPEMGTPNGALFTENKGLYQYGMIMALPPSLPNEGGEKIDREVIFILDTSGSMAGDSISQAKQALMLGVDKLSESDRFNLIEFNSYARSLWKNSMNATQHNKSQAKNFVQSLQADGGTEILPALQLALDNQTTNERNGSQTLRQVLFLTDGSVGNEDMLMEYIRQNLGRSRLFTIGIGSAPNSFFMSEAAAMGRGSFTYIGKVQEVKEKMHSLFSKLEHPAMTNIAVGLPGDAEFYPNPIPDLYAGEPLVLTYRTKTPQSEVVIDGHRGKQYWQQKLRSSGDVQSQGISVHWARKKIQQLSQEKRRADVPESYDKRILQTALEHHIVSSMTSLVAVDVTPVNPGVNAIKRAVANHSPAGWKMNEVFGNLPQTATPAWWHMWIGVFCLGVALCMRVLARG